ncbi:extracellular solute-binding protein [Solwaraspora sp. WMMA2080]|uniref:extracellular solute-binding protein n=1 Tax=unclassified Solwaraspora TaxID=2627926 RepID=UPI00248BAF01|nr:MULTISPECIES: extracellular solute-binding protein [unclassified Solwaraspora]WBB95558.1 extracellular solute-binding protein [Solwaraspora sp. WMMA2059]WBC20537.1 extracellular solute-binding protein [Solwaraspora sp. WMMA2080]
MATPIHFSRRTLLSLAGLGAGAVALGACGDSGSDSAGIEWWHIQNTDPMLPVWAAFAEEFQAQNEGVGITITPLENEAFKARLTTVTQAGDPPDIYHTWGGGVLRQQVEAGLCQDITDAVAPWRDILQPASTLPYEIDGRLYGVPFDIGMVGFWYNKALFADAGITAPPQTWAEYLEVVGRLRSAGITPIALAGGEKWPGHYYWAYLAMRIGGVEALSQAGEDNNFTTSAFIGAGERLAELVALEPFQEGFLGASYGEPDGQAAAMGNGDAAMELMGQWAPAVQEEASGVEGGIGTDLGFFPFPVVDGGQGSASDAFGGGGGFAIGRDASPDAIRFLEFISQVDKQRRAAATGAFLPVTIGAEAAIEDPNLAAVAETLADASNFQLYLDQAYAPAVGQEVNDRVAELIAGQMTPEQVAEAVTVVAQR